jgi:hypothetical protein
MEEKAMNKFIIPAAALLLVTAPAVSIAGTDTYTEERVEQHGLGGSKTVEKTVESESDDDVEVESVETRRTQRVDPMDAQVEKKVEKETVVEDD